MNLPLVMFQFGSTVSMRVGTEFDFDNEEAFINCCHFSDYSDLI